MNKKIDGGAILLLFIVTMLCFCLLSDVETSRSKSSQEQAVSEESIFDTSTIEENWCGENTDGAIRMVSALVVDDNEGLYTLEDETGNLWEVADVLIYPDDFLLLWIADCGTPDNVTDDLILKCWAEVH